MIIKKALRISKIILKVKRTKIKSRSHKEIKVVKLKMTIIKKIKQIKVTATLRNK